MHHPDTDYWNQGNWKEKVDPVTILGTSVVSAGRVQAACGLKTIFTGHEASSTSSGLRRVKEDNL